MKDTTPYKIYIDRTWGLFLGQIDDNNLHRHYALQICIASQGKFEITDENKNQSYYTACLINSNVLHQFRSKELSLVILINPLSSIGHQLYNRYRNSKVTDLNQDLKVLSVILTEHLRNDMDFEAFVKSISNYLADFTCECELENHFADDRIYRAIQYLEQNFDRVVPLEEVAVFCFLSETRFLHLFKEKTNLNFRRYQLWNKMIKSLPYLKTHSITETAHQFGFTDSSHYTRTFKETFGLNPKFLFHQE